MADLTVDDLPAPPTSLGVEDLPPPPKPQGLGFWDYLKGAPGAALNLATGAGASLAGGLSSAGSAVENAGRFVLNRFGANLPTVDEGANFRKVMSDLTYQPKSLGAQADVNALGYPAQKLGQFAQYAGGKAADLTGSPAAGAAVDTGIQAIPYALGALGAKFAPKAAPVAAAPELAPPVAQAARLGLSLTPEQAGGSFTARAIQSLTNSSKLERAVSKKNAPIVDNAAKYELGLPDTATLNESTLNALKKPANAVYDAVSKVGNVATDDTYRNAIAQVSNRTGSGSFSFDVPADIEKLKTQYGSLDTFDAGDAVQKIRQLRADAGNNIGAPHAPERNALGYAQRQIADALEEQLDRHIQSGAFEGPGGGVQSDLIGQFRDARQQLAKIRSVEDALEGGNVSAKALYRQLDRGVPLSGRLREVAQAYGNFDRALQSPSKIRDSGPFNAFDRSVSIPLSVAHPAIGAAVLAPPVARAILASKAYQRAGIQRQPLGIAPPLSNYSLIAPAAMPQGLLEQQQ